MIERYVHWNEDIGEWQLKCVAYTGNNMRKAQTTPPLGSNKDVCMNFINLIVKVIIFIIILISSKLNLTCQIYISLITMDSTILSCNRKRYEADLEYQGQLQHIDVHHIKAMFNL